MSTTHTSDTEHRTATWEPPGPGSWQRDTSHSHPAPTRFYRRILSEHTAPAYGKVMDEWGGALATIDMQIVNGDVYRRLVPLVGADRDNGKIPPKPVLWLATRLHPAFRKRNRLAQQALDERPYLDVIEGWATERDEWAAKNRELARPDPAELADAELAAHLDRLGAHAIAGWTRHHELHGADLGPIGDLLNHTGEWGLADVEVMHLLKGASPATVDAARHATRIADALREHGVDPAGVDDIETIRGVPDAAAHLDAYLDEFGWRLITGYDIEDKMLVELPSAICAIVRAAAIGDAMPADTIDTEHEERLAAAADDRALFDQLLRDARTAYGMRDDNGPLTWQWPVGLVRRAYLAAGERLAGDGRLDDAALVFELDIDELAGVLRGGSIPGDIHERADLRAWEATVTGPATLGPQPDGEPDFSVFPSALARVMGVVQAAVTKLDVDPDATRRPLHGLGIGDAPYTGVARVTTDPVEAIAEMEPGDILVAPWTSPTYNAVLAIAGAIVIQEGGLLCHAAVMARELELPAVIGCHAAMDEIRSGDRIEVDPAAGRVRVVESAATSS